jgi:hypothetical protein
MALPNAPASGLVATGRDNSGYAAILDQPRFDPVEFMALVSREKQAQALADKKNQIEKDTARAKAFASIVPKPEGTQYLPYFQEFNDKATQVLSDIAAQGGDVENSPEYRKLLTEKNALETATKGEQVLLKSVLDDFTKNRDVYEPEEIQAWWDGYTKSTNPMEGIKYIREAPRPKAPLRFLDIVPEKLPEPYMNVKDIGLFVDGVLYSAPDEKVREVYNQGVADGKWTDMEGMKQAYVDFYTAQKKEYQARQSAKPSTSTWTFSGGTGKIGPVTIQATDTTGSGKEWNTVTMNSTAAENQREVTLQDGEDFINGKVAGFRKDPSGKRYFILDVKDEKGVVRKTEVPYDVNDPNYLEVQTAYGVTDLEDAANKAFESLARTQKKPEKKAEGGYKIGQVMEGYRYTGGDPTKQENWEEVK